MPVVTPRPAGVGGPAVVNGLDLGPPWRSARPAPSWTTSRNLQATGKVRLAIGPTRDLVLIEGAAHALAATEIPGEVGDAFAAKTGFDPRQLTSSYRYFRIHPQRLQAWREANELEGRELMRGGHWGVP